MSIEVLPCQDAQDAGKFYVSVNGRMATRREGNRVRPFLFKTKEAAQTYAATLRPRVIVPTHKGVERRRT